MFVSAAGSARPLYQGGVHPRQQQGGSEVFRQEVELGAVEGRLAEGERRQGGGDLVAYGHRVVVLPLPVGGDHEVAEGSPVEARLVEAVPFRRPRLLLARVVDQPALGQVVAEDVVETVPLEVGADVAEVALVRVVGVLPLPPAVLGVELLRQVGLPQPRVERHVEHTGSCRRVLGTFFQHPAEAGAVVRCPGASQGEKDEDEAVCSGPLHTLHPIARGPRTR